MKELSIEEKAKRYESSLKRCMKLYNEAKANEYTSDIEDYETIFPELKESDESEDERIRKSIICALKQYYIANTVFDGFSREDMLAWLEKQGEQKPANSIWHDMTENPEGDENDRTLVVFEDGYSTTSNALLHIGFGTSKPYKWAYVNDILRLTSNTKQSEQKSAEWSEEDEKKINELTELCKGRKRLCSSTVISYKRMDVLQDWLKSLRPQSQWKPSEEQMDVLNAISNKDTLSEYEKGMLCGLYTELKNLSEE